MPKVPEVLAPRRKTRQIRVGKVLVGGDAPVSVQSMTTTPTTNINATLQQIAELTASGCEIVRVAVPSQDDADVLHIIAKKSQIPVIADIHFQPKYVFQAIDAGCGAVRVNPGNIRKFDDQVGAIAAAAKAAGVSLRIGVNAGSLDRRRSSGPPYGAGGRHETKKPPGGGLWSGNANTPPRRRATRCGTRACGHDIRRADAGKSRLRVRSEFSDLPPAPARGS
jgi:hypothetical protein